MKTDEEIEVERRWMEPLIGPTRTGWYVEACKVEYDAPQVVHLWASRYAQMAREAARLQDELFGKEKT